VNGDSAKHDITYRSRNDIKKTFGGSLLNIWYTKESRGGKRGVKGVFAASNRKGFREQKMCGTLSQRGPNHKRGGIYKDGGRKKRQRERGQAP